MQIERLKHLVAILEKVRPARFNISIWHVENSCGATACALGWASLDPEFNRQGFTLASVGGHWPMFKEHDGYSAAAEFFSITMEQSIHLFYPNEYPSDRRGPADVIARIKELLT